MLKTKKRIEPYTPHLSGTMLSADNFVQNPEYSQSYNRYSYCFNNPLKYIDPSGWGPPSDHERRRGIRDIPGDDGGPGDPYGTYSVEIVTGSSGGTNYFISDYSSSGSSGGINTGSGGNSGGPGGNGGSSYAYQPRVVYYGWSPPVYQPPNPNVINNAMNRANSGGGNSLFMIGSGINAAGFISSAGEYSNVINGSWRGANGKWNSLEWGGNQWTGARSKVISKVKVFKLASKYLFIVGTGISLYQGGNALLQGDYAGATKSGFDIGMGAFATFGGPFGWIFGGGYFALDALGMFGRPIVTTPIMPPSYAVQDNTYVVHPIIFPRP